MASTARTLSNEPSPYSRDSNVTIRASVLDAALQLGVGSSRTVTRWMFDNASVMEDDEEDQTTVSPGLTSASTATSEDSPVPPSPQLRPAQSNLSQSVNVTYSEPASRRIHFDLTNRPPDAPAVIYSYDAGSSFFKRKLKKPRKGDGYESDGGYASESARKDKKDKKDKKEKKKMGKKDNAAGDETDGEGTISEASAKRKKSKKNKKNKGGDAMSGDESDGGYLSESGPKKKKSFFRMPSRKDSTAPEDVPPPVPAMPDLYTHIGPLPIATKFSRSGTPLSKISSINSYGQSSTIPSRSTSFDSSESPTSSRSGLRLNISAPITVQTSYSSSRSVSTKHTPDPLSLVPPNQGVSAAGPTPSSEYVLITPSATPPPMSNPVPNSSGNLLTSAFRRHVHGAASVTSYGGSVDDMSIISPSDYMVTSPMANTEQNVMAYYNARPDSKPLPSVYPTEQIERSRSTSPYFDAGPPTQHRGRYEPPPSAFNATDPGTATLQPITTPTTARSPSPGGLQRGRTSPFPTKPVLAREAASEIVRRGSVTAAFRSVNALGRYKGTAESEGAESDDVRYGMAINKGPKLTRSATNASEFRRPEPERAPDVMSVNDVEIEHASSADGEDYYEDAESSAEADLDIVIERFQGQMRGEVTEEPEAYEEGDDDKSLYPDEDKTAGRTTMYELEAGSSSKGNLTIPSPGFDEDSRLSVWNADRSRPGSFLDNDKSLETRDRFVQRIAAMYEDNGREKSARAVGPSGKRVEAAIPPVPTLSPEVRRRWEGAGQRR